ncbi:MAG: hypothetical protein WA139_02985 [Candidatus Aenigmatarchaeota archaeon]
MKNKVVICNSAIFHKDAEKWKEKLEEGGYEVIKIPEHDINSLKDYRNGHTEHYRKIAEADILFVLNLEKSGIANYIGPSVFAEMAFAIGLNITLGKNIEIFCLNPLPKNLPYSDELNKWKELGWIKFWKEC